MNTNKVVVFFAFLLAAGVGFAQGARGMGGGGISGQPIDGTTIKPKSVQASGTGDQFVCTNATAVCEVESSINATTMTSTVPAFDIGPTATPDANDRLACFSYGPSGSKTRMMCVDKEGDVNASGDVIIPNPKRFCLNTSCTNNIKANATWPDDFELTTGSSVRMVINASGSTSFSATVGAAGLSSTGNINSSTASGNNAYTCTNTGCRLSLGNTARYFSDDGTRLNVNSELAATNMLAVNFYTGAAAVKLYGTQAARVGAAGNRNAGELTFAVNDGSDIFTVDGIGAATGDSFTATTASGSALTGGGASGTLLITSNTPDSVTGINGPAAITMQSSVALTSGDQVFRVLRNDGTQLFAVRNTGALVAGESTGQATINFGRWNSQQTAPTEWTNDAALTEKNPMRITHIKDVVADDASLLSIYDNIGTSATRQFYVSKDGLIRVNASNAAKPTCNADNRGRIFFLDGASLVADTFEVCGKDAANAYAWKAIVTF